MITDTTEEKILFNAALFSLAHNTGTLSDHVNFVVDTRSGVKASHDKYFCSFDCCENTIYQDGLCRVHWYKSEKRKDEKISRAERTIPETVG